MGERPGNSPTFIATLAIIPLNIYRQLKVFNRHPIGEAYQVHILLDLFHNQKNRTWPPTGRPNSSGSRPHIGDVPIGAAPTGLYVT